MARRSMTLLVCAALLAGAGAHEAGASEFGLSYTSSVSSGEEYVSTESGTTEGFNGGEAAIGFRCDMNGEFEFRWFIRKRVEIAKVGSWRDVRYRNCTNGYLVIQRGSTIPFYFEREVSALPVVRGIRARADTFSILTRGPMGEECQYINDRSSRERRTQIVFTETTSFVASGTLLFATDLTGGGACPATLRIAAEVTTTIPISVIGIN